MSSKKDKLLESAQKFIAKGQLDRAIKDYEQLVALDSGDIRHRQKLAELLVRANRKEEAIGEYEAIGKHYDDHAFYLKAIAVHKQIQKLDPGNVKVTLSLASLNEKQGLIGNALAEYNNALSYYQKTRQLPEAIKVLEQMSAVDPGNLNTLLKFAETYYSAGVVEKSYDQFTHLAMLLGKSGDESAFSQICNRVASLFPDRKDFPLELMAALVEEGSVNAAIPHLLALTGNDHGNRRAWDLLAEAYQQHGNQERYTATLQRMVTLFPEELSFREKLGQKAHAAESGEPDEAPGITTPAGIPEAPPPPEPSRTEAFPIADEVPVVAEPADYEEPWEEEIDLSLAEEEGRATDADRLSVRSKGEASVAESAQPAVESGGPVPEESSFDTPSLHTDFEEIDLEMYEEADESAVPERPGAYTDQSPLLDDLSEIDLAVDVDEDAGSGVPGTQDSDAGERPLSGEFLEINLEIDAEDDTVESSISEHEGVWTDESSLQPEDFSESDLVEMNGEASLSLDDLVEEAGDAEQVFPGLAVPEMESTTAMPGADAGMSEGVEDSPAGETMFDLGEELRQEGLGIYDEDSSDSGPADKYSQDGVFSAFKVVVDQQFDQEDTETHYNLGMAYKEMGLFDDAIAEFQAASRSAARAADCLTLQGICHRDKGDLKSAEETFRKGVALEGLSIEEALSLKYELALLLEGVGSTEEALQFYREVRELNSGFREVGSRIAAISGDEEGTASEELELLELDVEEME